MEGGIKKSGNQGMILASVKYTEEGLCTLYNVHCTSMHDRFRELLGRIGDDFICHPSIIYNIYHTERIYQFLLSLLYTRICLNTSSFGGTKCVCESCKDRRIF